MPGSASISSSQHSASSLRHRAAPQSRADPRSSRGSTRRSVSRLGAGNSGSAEGNESIVARFRYRGGEPLRPSPADLADEVEDWLRSGEHPEGFAGFTDRKRKSSTSETTPDPKRKASAAETTPSSSRRSRRSVGAERGGGGNEGDDDDNDNDNGAGRDEIEKMDDGSVNSSSASGSPAPEVEEERGAELTEDEIVMLMGTRASARKAPDGADAPPSVSGASSVAPGAVKSAGAGVEGDDAKAEKDVVREARKALVGGERDRADADADGSDLEGDDDGDGDGDIDGMPWSDGDGKNGDRSFFDGDSDSDDDADESLDGKPPGDGDGDDDRESAASFGSASYNEDDDILSVNNGDDHRAKVPAESKAHGVQASGRGRKIRQGQYEGLRVKVLSGPYAGVSSRIKASHGRGWMTLADHPDIPDGTKIGTSKLRIYHPDEDNEMSEDEEEEEGEYDKKSAEAEDEAMEEDSSPPNANEPPHPYVGKMVQIQTGPYDGLRGRVLRQESRGWWTLDCPELPPGKKIGNRQLRAVDDVSAGEILRYNRASGKICRKLAPAPKARNPEPVTAAAGKKRSRPDKGGAAGVTPMTVPAPTFKIRSLHDRAEDENDSEDAEDDDIIARTRRRLRGGQRRRDIRPASSSATATAAAMASPSTLTMNRGAPSSAAAGETKPPSSKRPSRAAAAAAASTPSAAHHSSAADTHTDRMPDSWRDSILASGASLRPDYFAPPHCSRYRRRHAPASSLGRPPPLPPVLLHPDDDVDAIPAALRHLSPDAKVDIFDRTTGKIRTGSEAVKVRDLPHVLRGNAALEPVVPPPPPATNGLNGPAAAEAEASATREGRSASEHPVRVNPGVLPQSKIRGSACEGREVAVTAGPYRGLVGKVEACLPGGWYLVSDLLEDDDHELDVVIASRHLQLLERVPDALPPLTPPTPAMPATRGSAGRGELSGGLLPSFGSAPSRSDSGGSDAGSGSRPPPSRGGGESTPAKSGIGLGEAAAVTPSRGGSKARNGMKNVPVKSMRLRIDALTEERRAILKALGINEDGERPLNSSDGVRSARPVMRTPNGAVRPAADAGSAESVVRSILGAGKRVVGGDAAATAMANGHGGKSENAGSGGLTATSNGSAVARGMDTHRLRSQLDQVNMKMERAQRDLEARLRPQLAPGMGKQI